jgi:hypothetical protein
MSETFDIDLTGVDTSSTGEGGWSAFPSGEYRVMITKAEVKDTRSGTGKRLALELTILSNDELNGRSHWEGINIINPSEVAQRIAHEHLAMLADASGLPRDFLKTAGVGALQGKVVLAQIAKVKAICRQGRVREHRARLRRTGRKGEDGATHVLARHLCRDRSRDPVLANNLTWG